MKKHRWAALLAAGVMALVGMNPASAGNEQAERERERTRREDALFLQARKAFWWGDFEEMSRLNALHKTPSPDQELGPDTAFWRLHLVRLGFLSVLKGMPDDGDAYFDELCALTLQWTRQHPASALARILHAQAIVARARHRFGTDLQEGSEEAAYGFLSAIRQASEQLMGNGQIARTDSSAHVELIAMGKLLGLPFEQLWAVAKDGLKISPHDISLYLEVLPSTLPPRGGSVELLDQYIQEATELDRDGGGGALYATLYAQAAGAYFGDRLFKDSRAQWPRIKAGFEQQMRHDRHRSVIDSYAYLACLAGDRETLKQQLALMTDRGPLLGSWGTDPQRRYDGCKRWAQEP